MPAPSAPPIGVRSTISTVAPHARSARADASPAMPAPTTRTRYPSTRMSVPGDAGRSTIVRGGDARGDPAGLTAEGAELAGLRAEADGPESGRGLPGVAGPGTSLVVEDVQVGDQGRQRGAVAGGGDGDVGGEVAAVGE